MQDLISQLNIIEYINVYLIMFLIAFGVVIKHVYMEIDNKYIPIILYAVAIAYMVVSTDGYGLHQLCNVVVDATISTAVAIGLHSGLGKPLVKYILKRYIGSTDTSSTFDDQSDDYVEDDSEESEDDTE